MYRPASSSILARCPECVVPDLAEKHELSRLYSALWVWSVLIGGQKMPATWASKATAPCTRVMVLQKLNHHRLMWARVQQTSRGSTIYWVQVWWDNGPKRSHTIPGTVLYSTVLWKLLLLQLSYFPATPDHRCVSLCHLAVWHCLAQGRWNVKPGPKPKPSPGPMKRWRASGSVDSDLWPMDPTACFQATSSPCRSAGRFWSQSIP